MPERLILVGSDANVKILKEDDRRIDYWPTDLKSLVNLIMGNLHLIPNYPGNTAHPLKDAAQYYEHVNLHWTICRGDHQSQGDCILYDKTLSNPTEYLQRVCEELNKPSTIPCSKSSGYKQKVKKHRHCGWFFLTRN